jgi:hypothetical protein
VRVNFTAIKRPQKKKKVAETNPAGWVTWLQCVVPPSALQLRRVVCGACSHLAFVPLSFSSVSKPRYFLSSFLSRTDLVQRALNFFGYPLVLGPVILRNLRRNFVRHFVAGPHFWWDWCRTTVELHIGLYSPTDNSNRYFLKETLDTTAQLCEQFLVSLACSASRWVMQFLPVVGMWQSGLSLSGNALHVAPQ